MMDLYLMSKDGKPVKFDGIRHVDGPIIEPSPDTPKFLPGDICEFHCKVETDPQAWQQLIDETNQQTITAFDLLKQATFACLNNKCDECPIRQADGSCQDWIEKNIETLIENQKRLYVQMTKDRREKNGKDNNHRDI